MRRDRVVQVVWCALATFARSTTVIAIPVWLAIWSGERTAAAPPSSEPPSATAEVRDAVRAGADGPPAPAPIQFNFKGATFEQVLDFFSRATGMPVVWETDPPEGTLDYLSPRTYETPEALRVLNVVLQSRGVMLRVDDGMLYLQKLSEMQRENIPTFIGALPDEVTDEQIVTVVFPLAIATAETIAEKFSTMVASYGSVTAMAQQNALLITETASQVRRLTLVLEELDRADPEGAVEIIKLRHTKAAELMGPLKALLSRTVERYVMDKKNKPKKVVQQEMSGLSISPDPRTNSIIAKGVQSRIDKLRETIAILDIPTAGSVRTTRSFTLGDLTPDAAANALNAVFAKMPEAERPVVLPQADRGRVTLVGAESAIEEATSLLREIDTDGPRAEDDEDVMSAIALDHVEPARIVDAIRGLLTERQRARLRVLAGPDHASVLLAGPPADVAAVQEMIPDLDVPEPSPHLEIEFFRLVHARAETLAPIVTQLLAGEQARVPAGDRVRVTTDARLNALIVSGTEAGLDLAAEMIMELDVDPEDDAAAHRSLRVLVVRNADAAAMAKNLEALFANENDAPPTIRVDQASNTLLIRAHEAQHESIQRVVEQVDRATIVSTRQMRTLTIDPSKASAADVARSLKQMLDRSGNGRVEIITLDELLKVNAPPANERIEDREDDRAPSGASSSRTGRAAYAMVSMVVSTAKPATDAGTEFVDLLQRILAPRVDDADDADAADVADVPAEVEPVTVALTPVPESVAAPGTPANGDALRTALATGQDVTIAVDPATNSIVLVGAPRAIERVESFARQVQDQIPALPGKVRFIALPPESDARTLARLVDQTLRIVTPAGGRRGELRRRAAVIADTTNNALIVTCTDPDFETIGSLVATLAQPMPAERVVVKVYPLATIAADRAAASVRELIAPNARNRGRNARQVRELAITLLADDQSIDAVFDPAKIRVTPDQHTNSLVVRGPEAAVGFIDQYMEMIDLAPAKVRSTLKLYPLRHARARDLQGMLRGIFRARVQGQQRDRRTRVQPPEFSADARTNTLLVTASPEHLVEVEQLLEDLDRELGDDVHPLRMIELAAAQPSRAARMLEDVVIGSDQMRRATTLVKADDASGMLLIRASDAVNAEIDAVLSEIDRDAAGAFEVRTITLERAEADAVAYSLQRFFDDRARIASVGRGRRAQARRVSIVGDPASSTILVAASDADYAEIEKLVAQFDTPQATDAWSFRVFALEHAKAADIEQTLQQMINNLNWNQGPTTWGRGRRVGARDRGTLAIESDARLNAIIATGEGDKFALVEELIAVLDAPESEGAERVVRLYKLEHANVDVIADVVRELFTDVNRARRWWEQQHDPNELKVRVDRTSKTLIISGTEREHEEVAAIVADIDGEVAPPETEVAVLAVEFADAGDVQRTLRDFLRNRARSQGLRRSTGDVTASRSTNSVVVSAPPTLMATIRDLVTRMDQPDVSGDRVVEIIALVRGDAEEITRILREQFGRRRGTGVVVTTDLRTNSLIITAPKRQFAQVRALVEQLDEPGASDETIIRTYALQGAQADEAVRILRSTLQLDARGATDGISIKLDEDTPSVEVRAQIVPDPRSNSIIVTATPESLPVIESLIRTVDDVPAVSPVEYRIIPLEYAMAEEVYFTLRRVGVWRDGDGPQPVFDFNSLENQLIVSATADQFEQIDKIIVDLDQPSERQRVTDFVPLQFAEAEKVAEALEVFYGTWAIEADTPGKRNTRIVADPATNSLVITADEAEWTDIRALLAKLDSEEYDASLQLEVIPLTYADARSVAGAINDAFQGRIERDRRSNRSRDRARGGDGDDRRDPGEAPAVLVEAEEWVGASAEPQTNSVIVSANRQNIRKIREIVSRLDVADFARMPAPRLIPVSAGDPEELAAALTQLYEQDRGARQGVRIIGDRSSNTLVVRANDDEFDQISALAEALQEETAATGVTVQIISVAAIPAGRVVAAIRDAYEERANQANIPLSIEIDPVGNNLVVASTAAMIAEVEDTVAQLDRLAPAAGQGIFIIELEHIAPDEARSVIETIGLDQPPRDDSTSRIVTEPLRVSELAGRNAIVVVANPADRDTIVEIVKAIDVETPLADSEMRVVTLRNADAGAVAQLLVQVLTPGAQQVNTRLARAVQEQVRRLAVRRDGLDEVDLQLDLTKPIRVIPDATMNALVLSSTAGNVAALADLIEMFDALPITDAVTVQLFPLENIAAGEFLRIVRDLFTQGKQLGGTPGSTVRGVPAGMVGKALLDEIAISADDRTNTVLVAGGEDSVALVEVLTQRLDTDVTIGWIEPKVLRLKFADATDLAESLDAILVHGVSEGPQAGPLQRQVGRLRLAKQNGLDNGEAMHVLESDVFQPMGRLVIRPDAQLNALILVGTPVNLEVVTELVAMLDVEAASPDATVRIYPVENASAARLQTIITQLFEQQVRSKAIRPEDRVIVEADQRTNSLIVTTSPRSFAVLEGLLASLDVEVAPDVREIRRIEIEHAAAERLAVFIQEAMDARLERLRSTQPETAELERATILADSRTNTLVVVAGDEAYDVIERLAGDLDHSTLIDQGLLEVMPVVKGNADRIAQAIEAVMERRYANIPDALRQSQQPLVLTDPRTSSLLVAANPEDLLAIRDLLDRLADAPSDPAVGLHVIALPYTANAEALSPRLQRLMRERQESLGEGRRPSDRVAIEPDSIGNTIVVAASDENVEVVRDLLAALMRAGSETLADRAFDVVPLRMSRASEMVELLDDLYVAEANRIRGDDAVRVTADDRINAVLVSASTEDILEIRDLIDELDGARPGQVVEIKYISLQSANALETVSLIQNVLSGRGIGARGESRRATVVKYLREIAKEQDRGGRRPGRGGDPESEMEVSAAIRESIVLTPDVRTNTIIVSAPQQSMQMLEQMIRDLDSSSTGAKNIAIFKLINADATAMAEIITDLFNLRQGRDFLVLKPREGDGATGGGADAGAGSTGLAGTDLTAVPDERQQLSITVDSRTNSLLVSGSPTYLELVSNVVEELDALEANERQVYVYKLLNASALEVADVLGEFVREEQEKLVSTLSPDQIGSAARLLEREITIRGDEKSNSVLISASPRYLDRVKQMVRELDVDPPQVLIQVMLAEVTLDSEDEWGVDLMAMFETGSALVTGGFGLGSAFVTGPGVPSFSIAAADFDMMIRAMEEQGRLAVLSNPSIMAANNETARIQVGEEIRVPTTTSFTDAGNSNTSTEARDVGIILEVTPSINPDGYVRLSVEPEISSLSDRTTQINEDLASPIITLRTADTTVTVRDGQTIVIGGLISDRYERRDRKVPLLGDIPFLGALFRTEVQSTATTELMIVLTPHVIESPTDQGRVEQLTTSELDRLSLPESVKERIRTGNFDLSGGLYDAQGNPVRLDLGAGER